MVLHIFNPEHDMALACNREFFTPPKAARLTRVAFCHKPAAWADDGDWILVDDIAVARLNMLDDKDEYAQVEFVTIHDIALLTEECLPEKILPWGWDRYLVAQLLQCNPLLSRLMPSDEQLNLIRMLSSRCFVAEALLPELVESGAYVGEMVVCKSEEEVNNELQSRNNIVVKSPWSCSGRGVRFIRDALTQSERGWITNVLKEQGNVVVEPMYNKVKDFAMEFYTFEYGTEYHGLNIFETRNGAYLGNITGTEEEKLAMLDDYVATDEVMKLKDKIIAVTTELFRDRYVGPFGIDMMVVLTPEGKFKIHPCVEMNLRRTMGQMKK